MAPPKIIVLNNASLAAMNPDGVPDPRRDPQSYGSWVENACLAHAWKAGQRVMYWREEPLEVDAVLEGTWGAWAIEVKTRRCTLADLPGLAEFCRRNRRFRALVLADSAGDVARVEEAGFAAMGWRDYLAGGLTPLSRDR